MKVLLRLTFLAALGLVAEANLGHLKPLDIMMPVNPNYTAQEWKEIYAAQKPRPDDYPNFKKGTEAQPEYDGKIDVHPDEQHLRITNGSPAQPCQFPYQVAVIIDNAYLCGGTLIAPQWVLTAAHCVYGRSSFRVVLGTIYYNGSGGTIVTSTNATVHPNYNESTINNDVALIRLPNPVTYTNCIRCIRLCDFPCDLAGERVLVSGWGRTCDTCNPSPTLNYVEQTVITNTACASVFGSIITPSKICTATTPGYVSTCNGDSGGPLVYLESGGGKCLAGVVSFISSRGCESGYPDGFSRVTWYVSWIVSVTGRLDCC